jgi:hypothetical protein
MSIKTYCSKYAKTHINVISINHQNKTQKAKVKGEDKAFVLTLKPSSSPYKYNEQPKKTFVKTNPNNLLFKSSL